MTTQEMLTCMCVHAHMYTHSIYTVHIYGNKLAVARESRPHKSAAMHGCHLSDGDGGSGMQLSTQQRTEQQ